MLLILFDGYGKGTFMFNIAAVNFPKGDKKSMVDVIKKEYWFTIFSWHIWCLSWARTKYWLWFFRYSNRVINKCDSFNVFSVDLFKKKNTERFNFF